MTRPAAPPLNLFLSIRDKLGPILVFSVTVAAAVWLYVDHKQAPSIVGFAHGIEHDIAPLDTGRVVSVAVDVGQAVQEGAVLAVLDSTEIDAQLSVLEAERARAEAELAAAEAAARRGAMERERALADDLARLERALAEARSELRAASAEYKSRDTERKRLEDLVAQKLADRDGLAQLEARVATLKARADGSRSTVRLLERQTEDLKSRIDLLTADEVAVAVGPLRRQLDVIDGRLARLRARRAELVLRSPAAGTVADVDLHPGSVAGPGRPVLQLVSHSSGKVVACITEDQALDVRVGDPATLWLRKSGRSDPMTGQVMSLGPLVDTLPSRCRPNLRDKAWGRDVVILLDQAIELLPGQALDVRIERGEGAVRGARAAPPAPTLGEPRPVDLPSALRERSTFEPSALVWLPHLARYVVASDDTGLKGGKDDHAPWLFGMDSRGRVDEVPLGISGVDTISDLEGLALGRGGALYALASQSLSKKGKRPAKRQRFLRLRPTSAGFAVSGAVKLAELLDALPPDDLERTLGLTDTRGLDIEGLAAHEGALLLGLKAPLDADGRALIWRLDRPERLFDSGQLEVGDLRVWARVPLQVDADGRRVPAGIAELLSLPDGALVVAATAPGDPQRQSGAIWWVPEPAPGELTPLHVRTFDGLKPEGLALSPTPGRLAITFDRGADTAWWTELDWPLR